MSLCNRIPRLLTCNSPTKVLSISSNKFSTESDNLKISLNEQVSQRIYIHGCMTLRKFRIPNTFIIFTKPFHNVDRGTYDTN